MSSPFEPAASHYTERTRHNLERAEAKIAALRDAGIEIAETPSDMADALLRIYKG